MSQLALMAGNGSNFLPCVCCALTNVATSNHENWIVEIFSFDSLFFTNGNVVNVKWPIHDAVNGKNLPVVVVVAYFDICSC